MSSDPTPAPPAVAIAVSGLGKRYRLHHQGQTTLKTAALRLFTRGARRDEEFWALRGVSFEVRQGETLGVIGRNGAGKSTLLGMIAGTVTPTEGGVRTSGRISSLLELGAGFHPDLTGRENVFLNGSILGLRRREIAQRLDAIVAFSDLERFIDHPVKHYSSGMFVRLAFSVAMEVDPDILILDEVLSVGDERFREKCRVRIGEFRRRGKTFLMVSHDMDTVQSLCDRVLVLERGTTILEDLPARAVSEYHAINALGEGAVEGPEQREWGSREAVILDVDVRDALGARVATLGAREGFTAAVRWRASRRIADPVFGFALSDIEGRVLYGTNTAIDGCSIAAIEGEGTIEFQVDAIPFQRGRYFLTFAIHSRDHKTFHRLENCRALTVTPDGEHAGTVQLAARWKTLG
jgi:ABC-type polysaccharide/polyol phosphate transport system ATPase subunit